MTEEEIPMEYIHKKIQKEYENNGGKNFPNKPLITIRPSEAEMELIYIHEQETLEGERRLEAVERINKEVAEDPLCACVGGLGPKGELTITGKEIKHVINKVGNSQKHLQDLIDPAVQEAIRKSGYTLEQFYQRISSGPKEMKEVLKEIGVGE